MNFYRFHLGDYYKKTSHLSIVEDGAYRRLIDAIYLREQPLPADKEQIFRLVRAFSEEEKIVVGRMLAEFFTLTDAGYTNARCDEELASIRTKSAKASQSAGMRWRNANAYADADANAMRTQSEGNASHKPVTISQDSSSRAREDEPERAPITNHHRVLAANLLDRGKTNLSNWERRFLTDTLGRSSITPKMQETLDNIAAKIGFTMTDTMALWTKRLKAARRLQQWDRKWGPPPRQIGCLAPDELLEPTDGEGWTDLKASA